MKRLLILCFSLIFSSNVWAAELVMFETAYCEWCDKWQRDIGATYDKTETAKIAPLRRVMLGNGTPKELRSLKPVIFYPTFIIINEGKEQGRIIGYQGKKKFSSDLEKILSQISGL